ncbi:hypothetical protein CEXT_254711 [Caerostris extrusa]|uniref:Uncharacterized protein n=1 Tax=Caerostris extrusa TaxID=172846 RepID=A0AAV4PYR5_CAEEX|nr:hypothetical protein CEXT_254711 [Caerostris extrusa]
MHRNSKGSLNIFTAIMEAGEKLPLKLLQDGRGKEFRDKFTTCFDSCEVGIALFRGINLSRTVAAMLHPDMNSLNRVDAQSVSY